MDKVADLLIRVKNGYMASSKEVAITYSKLNLSICQLLLKENYIDSMQEEADKRLIRVKLKYQGRNPVLTDVKRISKPGRRVYKGSKFLPYVNDGLGIVIVSTPKGIMSDRQARKEGLGGEVMAFVW